MGFQLRDQRGAGRISINAIDLNMSWWWRQGGNMFDLFQTVGQLLPARLMVQYGFDTGALRQLLARRRAVKSFLVVALVRQNYIFFVTIHYQHDVRLVNTGQIPKVGVLRETEGAVGATLQHPIGADDNRRRTGK